MSGLFLPTPKQIKQGPLTAPPSSSTAPTTTKKNAPSYEQRLLEAKQQQQQQQQQQQRQQQGGAGRGRGGGRGRGFTPRSTAHFDDGGAFPEIHMLQYPRHMGNPNKRRVGSSTSSTSTNQITGTQSSTAIVEIGKDGKSVDYTSIVKRGTNSDKTVYANLDAMRKLKPSEVNVDMPTEAEEIETMNKTQAALMKIVGGKIAKSKASGDAVLAAASANANGPRAQFVKYRPDANAPGYNPNAAERVIKIVEAAIDPMEPPKHKHRKVPRGPADDLVPILHSPPKKLTKEDQAAWQIPPCVSNWKNTKGYTIPLDKRLAADGRGLVDSTINNNFATLSESLYVAERQAREEVRLRSKVNQKLAQGEKERREAGLRELAQKARMERGGGGGGMNGEERLEEREELLTERTSVDNNNDDTPPSRPRSDSNENSAATTTSGYPDGSNNEDEVAAKQRDLLRQARKREREREMRLENLKGSAKRARDDDRDVSEKIALGVHVGSGAAGGAFDTRLYNQSEGIGSGFGADDEYNTYSKPLFDRDEAAKSVYRPTRGENDGLGDADEQVRDLKEGANKRFKPDTGFSGTDTGGRGVTRNAPVQFEMGLTNKK